MSTHHISGKQVSANISEAMKAKGVSRKAVYDAANITRHTFDRRMSSGEGWTLDELEKVANFLGISTWSLMSASQASVEAVAA